MSQSLYGSRWRRVCVAVLTLTMVTSVVEASEDASSIFVGPLQVRAVGIGAPPHSMAVQSTAPRTGRQNGPVLRAVLIGFAIGFAVGAYFGYGLSDSDRKSTAVKSGLANGALGAGIGFIIVTR